MIVAHIVINQSSTINHLFKNKSKKKVTEIKNSDKR